MLEIQIAIGAGQLGGSLLDSPFQLLGPRSKLDDHVADRDDQGTDLPREPDLRHRWDVERSLRGRPQQPTDASRTIGRGQERGQDAGQQQSRQQGQGRRDQRLAPDSAAWA